MMKFKNNIIFILLIFFFVSCSSTNIEKYNYEDQYVSVKCNIENNENKYFDLVINNKSDDEIIILLSQAKVIAFDDELVNILTLDQAFSKKTQIILKNEKLKPNAVFINKFSANGYMRKQILIDEIILLPWIKKGAFHLEIPYIIFDSNNYQGTIIIDL